MNKYRSKYFGEINLKESKGIFLEGEVKYKGEIILLEFELIQNLRQDEIVAIEDFLDNFESVYLKIYKYLKSSLYKIGFVKDYISIIQENFRKDMRDLLKGTNPNLSQEERLFSQLYICRIEFFQEGEQFAILDFTIDEGATNDLLVVGLDKSGDINYMMVDS